MTETAIMAATVLGSVSLTAATNSLEPALAGVPLTVPVFEFNDKADGRLPLTTDQA